MKPLCVLTDRSLIEISSLIRETLERTNLPSYHNSSSGGKFMRRELHGISWALASVVLHFAFPNRYPILDFRAIWSLHFRKPKSYTFDFWQLYVERFRALQRKTRLPARRLDRGLWMFSKLKQARSRIHTRHDRVSRRFRTTEGGQVRLLDNPRKSSRRFARQDPERNQ